MPRTYPFYPCGGRRLLSIVFASRNEGKIREVKAILDGTGINILSLKNYQHIPEIVEDGLTFFENAYKKAQTVSLLTGEPALADDSGLAVDALFGAPGVYSARYSGPDATDADNMARLLRDMINVSAGKREASFICVLVLYYPGGKYLSFTGRWQGQITYEQAGNGGFGYDPVFYVPDQGLTAAQLLPEVKNMISHRARALTLLKEALIGKD